MATVTKSKGKSKFPQAPFQPVGDYLDGNVPLEKTPVNLALWKLSQERNRYGRIKLAAALAGDIDRERDGKVESYAQCGERTKLSVIRSRTEKIRAVNESLREHHATVLTHALVDKALALLISTRTTGEKLVPAKPSKGYRFVMGDDLKIREEKMPPRKSKPDDGLGKCKCEIHKTHGALGTEMLKTMGVGQFSKARRQADLTSRRTVIE